MDKSGHKTQNVVSMSEYQPESGFAAIAQVEAYWEALRGTRMVPKRSQIDPRGIETALEYAFIVERIGPGIARLRVAGRHLNDLIGMEVRGMPLTSLFSPQARPQVSETLENVFQAPGVSNMHLLGAGAAGRPEGDARMVLLPLKSDLGDVSRLLGCLVFRGQIGLVPRRLDIVSKTFSRLTPGSDAHPPMADIPHRQHTNTPPPAQGFAAPKTAFEGKGPHAERPPSARPPYLRLIKSDD